ncbi:MAG TPA: beta-galactosidase [Gemmatirosa sp.]
MRPATSRAAAARLTAALLTAALLAASLVATAPLAAQPAPHDTGPLVVDSGRFLLNGRPFQILSGELHYARVPRAYWRDRLRKARAMGLNTISTYVFWNLHETTPGHYDFSGERDVATFIRTAQEEGLHVILRPGPYVCAEWELGGYPGWLLADTTLVLRSTEPHYTAAVERWLTRLGREVGPLLASRGGPIIAVQVENEYGSFGADHAYMRWQRDALRRAGLGDALLYTSDGNPRALAAGTLPDLPAVVNFGAGGADTAFAHLRAFRPTGPIMSGEYWAGWFDSWGQPHHTTDVERERRELQRMVDSGYSVNLYMFHGGTSPGFMNGANIDNGHYAPETSAYDYDAALDLSGRPTAKYAAFRAVLAARAAAVGGPALPAVPPSDSTISVAPFALPGVLPLWSQLGRPVRSERPRPMEQFGQSYGYIAYRTHVAGPERATLAVHDVRDYAQVYVNGTLAGTLDRRRNEDSLAIDVPASGAELTILVENTGRINFNRPMREERKGITRAVLLGGRELTGWEVFSLPMAAPPRGTFRTVAAHGTTANGRTPNAMPGASAPAFYRGTFDVARPGDTFLDTRGWGKGTVWVNGHQLGRVWDVGPQQTLYVPGPWLHRTGNEVVVFTLVEPKARTMAGLPRPVYDTGS